MSGQRTEFLYFAAGATLERNRLVTLTKSTGTVAYSTYGDSPDGFLISRASVADGAAVVPIEQQYRNMILKCETAVVTKGDPVFAGADGKICAVPAALAAVISKNVLTAPTGTQGDVYIVPANAAGWSTSTAGQIATKGASAWAYANATVGLVAYCADEKRYYICSATNTWVLAKIVGYAAETASAGDEIEVYNTKARARVVVDALPAGMAYMIVAAGQSASETDSDATVTVTDERIASTDIAICTAFAGTTGASLPIVKAVCTTDTLTITLSGNGGAGTIINYIIIRVIS